MNRKKISFLLCLIATMLISAFSISVAEKLNTDSKQQLRDPDIKPRKANKPVKVFILAGQSNMQGHASVSTIDYIGDDPKTAPMLLEMQNINSYLGAGWDLAG